MHSKHLFLYAFELSKDNCDVDVKSNLLPSEIHTAKVDLKSQILSRHWAYFWGGGLLSEKIKTIDKKILSWLLVG